MKSSCFATVPGTLFPPYKVDYADHAVGEYYDAIAFQPGYRGYSVEELRVADYAQGRMKASGPIPFWTQGR